MADKLIFQIYYGEGEIMYGPNSVDLSGFRHVVKGLSKANERTIVGVQMAHAVFPTGSAST